MGDYYTEDPSRLEGQPKRALADYVESQGILAPRRFRPLREAKASGLPIFTRSEHKQEYNGVSGLLESRLLKEIKGVTDEQDLKRKLLASRKGVINTYCSLSNKSHQQFEEEASYSYWEYIQGLNRVVVADSAVKGRYHLLTDNAKEYGYTLIENGKIVQQMMKKGFHEKREDLEKTIELYESVRKLERFDPNHCPIIETVGVDGKIYFLQYHRARDFQESTFILEREPKKDEIEARFVRGATPPEGKVYTITTVYPAEIKNNDEWEVNAEEGSFDMHFNEIFSELMVRKRKLQVIAKDEVDFFLHNLAIGHFNKSKVFKPEVSVLIERGQIYTKEERERDLSKLSNGVITELRTIQVKVIADGRRAYLKRIGS